jgi:uncharacterized protein YerC
MSKAEQEDLFIQFAQAIAIIRSPVEAAKFIKDLLSDQEAIMLARRLQIANLLDQGHTYAEIQLAMPVSHPTIAKVQLWLQEFGDGFREVLRKARKNEPKIETHEGSEWHRHKKKYPLYYWPSLLLEEVVKSANKKRKHQLRKVIEQLKEKTALTQHLKKLLGDS